MIKYILKGAKNHPLYPDNTFRIIRNILIWQIQSRIFPKKIFRKKFIGSTFLFVKKGMNGATGNLYYGLHDFTEMSFLLHFLKPQDLFIDVGANIGSYTVLASGVAKCTSVSFEPHPVTFSYLKNNVKNNGLAPLVTLHNLAVGSKMGFVSFTKEHDTINHIVSSKTEEKVIQVKVNSLDSVVVLDKPTIIKIDVEGYELEVIKGSINTLKSNYCIGVILEINGSNNKYGYKDSSLVKVLNELEFKPYHYDPFQRVLTSCIINEAQNYIFIKDFKFVQKRLKNGLKIKLFNNFY